MIPLFDGGISLSLMRPKTVVDMFDVEYDPELKFILNNNGIQTLTEYNYEPHSSNLIVSDAHFKHVVYHASHDIEKIVHLMFHVASESAGRKNRMKMLFQQPMAARILFRRALLTKLANQLLDVLASTNATSSSSSVTAASSMIEESCLPVVQSLLTLMSVTPMLTIICEYDPAILPVPEIDANEDNDDDDNNHENN